MSFQTLLDFEQALGRFTGAPYVVAVDCCTYAIEACMLYRRVEQTTVPAHTYLSVIHVLTRLRIEYELVDQPWRGEYQFGNTRIWDSAQRLEPGMYRSGQMQCLSFGFDKPLSLEHGGAILLDDPDAAKKLACYTRDGRDLTVAPWQKSKVFALSQHHCMRLATAAAGLKKLASFTGAIGNKQYPDLREIQVHAHIF